ncbi:SDR family NAD(P)-dependent oxidoreductase [Gracilibacillus timonensis]|uniref:SDR family NAD(P)-dependent oxidoreductase n=1 Tax=Gracilibacillus timonensis TaxID=1816696 RepID=UPI0008250726|nr:SDR family NAD(P)-dependent oxidoreductase [Gracilibacillus timonensis]
MKPLEGKIALVTGASRGAGRGIAIELAQAGATVYLTGRSTKHKSINNWPGTIDDTASKITSDGGNAIAVRCDHTKDVETEAVIDKIRQEQGKLDILVNNVWGAHDLGVEAKPFWQLSLKNWETMFTAGVRAQLATNYFAVPLLRKSEQALIIHTTFWDDNKYTGQFYYDLAKQALIRMSYGLSIELKPENIAVIAVSPGFMRTELVLQYHASDEENWQEAEDLSRTETPHYVGKGVAALAGDPTRLEKTGRVFRSADLAKMYQFTDIDGRFIPPFTL